MTLYETSVIALAIVTLAAARFGIPMLVIWLFKMGCCRVFKLTPR